MKVEETFMNKTVNSKILKTCLLLAILAFSLALGLNIKPVNAQRVEITNVEHPEKVPSGATFRIYVIIEYTISQPTDIVITIEDANGRVLETTLRIGHEEGVQVSGREEAEIYLLAPTPESYPYIWQLTATASLSSSPYRFSIEVVSPEEALFIDVVGVIPHTSEGEPPNVRQGEVIAVEADIFGCIPTGRDAEGSIKVTLQLNPRLLLLSLLEKPPWREEEGRFTLMDYTYETSNGEFNFVETKSYSDVTYGGCILGGRAGWFEFRIFIRGVIIPFDFTGDWAWEFYAILTADGEEVTDSETLTFTVQPREEVWANIAHVHVPAWVAPGEDFPMEVVASYFFPEGEQGSFELRILHEGTVIQVHTTPLLSGGGSHHEVFTLTAPENEGRWPLTIELRRMGEVLDSEEEGIAVTSEAPSMDDYRLCIGGVTAPQQVTYGEGFPVSVSINWNFPSREQIPFPVMEIYIGIDAADFPAGAFSCEWIENPENSGSQEVQLYIPGYVIPPRNGPWRLRALAYFRLEETSHLSFTPECYMREFEVTVVGAEGPTGGGIDWAVADAQVSPFQPIVGSPVVFQALIQASPQPSEPTPVKVSCRLDGEELFSGYVTYEPRATFLTVSLRPWVVTLGNHALTWVVDPDEEYNDPNAANNEKSISFTVVESYVEGGLPPTEGGEGPPPGEEFDFYVTVSPSEQTLVNPSSFTVMVNLVSGASQPVSLELLGAPAGLSYYFNPASGNPNFGSTLTLTSSSRVPAGVYTLTVKASGGGKERYAPIILRVEEAPTYDISISPSRTQAKPGESVSFTVTVSSDTGYSQYVNLAVSGVPEGASWTLEPQASLPNFNSALTLTLGKNVKPGFYRLTVTGSGPNPKRAVATLRVVGAEAEAGPLRPQPKESLVNLLAALLLGLMVAAVVGGGFLAFKRLRARRVKAYCIECGAKIPLGSEFCPKCGAKQLKEGES